MRAVRCTLVALGVTGTCVLLPVTAADAHIASAQRGCDAVTVRLTGFRASAQVPNTVEVRRNGVRIDLVRFRTTGTEKTYRESSPDPVTYEVSWTRTGPDRHTGRERALLQLPSTCDRSEPATPASTPTPSPAPTPTASPSPTPAPAPAAGATPPTTPAHPSWFAEAAPYAAGLAAVWVPIGAVLAALTLVRRRRATG